MSSDFKNWDIFTNVMIKCEKIVCLFVFVCFVVVVVVLFVCLFVCLFGFFFVYYTHIPQL